MQSLVVSAVVACALATLATGCGPKPPSKEDVQASASKYLAVTYGGSPRSFEVTCPRGLTGTNDAVNCEVEGPESVMGITVSEDAGGHLDFQISVHG